jgi:hypothetical protein
MHAEHPSHDAPPSPSAAPDLLGRLAAGLHEVSPADAVAGTLQRTVDLAVQLVEGCDLADIMLVDDERVVTPVMTAPLAARVDQLQAEHGEGPCYAVISEGVRVARTDDLAEDDRWPTFGRGAAELGVRSAVAYRLELGGRAPYRFGSLNLYARQPRAFRPAAVAVGEVLSAYCRWALDTAMELEGLRAAIASRDLIGQAKGILMERHGLSAEEAFELLRTSSQDRNTKLRDVADEVIGGRPIGDGDHLPGA